MEDRACIFDRQVKPIGTAPAQRTATRLTVCCPMLQREQWPERRQDPAIAKTRSLDSVQDRQRVGQRCCERDRNPDRTQQAQVADKFAVVEGLAILDASVPALLR